MNIINHDIKTPLIFIILIVAGYLMWNNFELPTVFMGKTEKVEGKIFEIRIGYGIKGIGYIQNAKFVYEKDGKYIEGKKKVDNKYSAQTIGNRVSLKISSKNPDKYEILGFFPDFSKINYSTKKYLKSENDKYTEIEFSNGIYISKTVENGGIERIKRFGLYYKKNDTITVDIFKEVKYDNQVRILKKDEMIEKFKQIKNSKNEKELLNLKTSDIYNLLSEDKKVENKNKNKTKGAIKLTSEK